VSDTCEHIDTIAVTELPDELDGCEDCLRTGGRWVHLRMCTTCGQVGCCDSSPNRHARAHASQTGHQIVRSAEPGEEWFYCFEDDLMFTISHEALR
jgi:hypothetical protein